MIHLRDVAPPVEELSERYGIGAVADAWSQLNADIGDLRKRREHLEMLLIEASTKGLVDGEEPWWDGNIIEGKTCRVRARKTLVEGGDRPRFDVKLAYVREHV